MDLQDMLFQILEGQKEIKEQLSRVEERLDKVEQRLDKIEERLQNIEEEQAEQSKLLVRKTVTIEKVFNPDILKEAEKMTLTNKG